MADEIPGGAISAALGLYSEGNTAEAQALALVAIASALNQLARVMRTASWRTSKRRRGTAYRPAANTP
jgi:hypothetical protein